MVDMTAIESFPGGRDLGLKSEGLVVTYGEEAEEGTEWTNSAGE